MASDAENDTLKREIIQCLQNQEQSLSYFRQMILNKDVIVFFGNTRSGKSTLVNYMIDNELEAWESGKMEFKIRIKEDFDEGPEIGQGSLSCTTLPGVYKMQGRDDVVVVDLPGFEDNRGVVQDIMNALCISQIKAARTIKFVLVFDINEITSDNVRNFTNSLHQIQDLVRNFDELKNSFCAIFTKDWKNYTQEEIVWLLYNKILNQDQLSMDKTLVRHFAEKIDWIGIFRMPQREGDISVELDINVKGAIRKCHEVDVEKCDIKFAFSDKAQEALLQIYPEYTDTNYFKGEANKIIQRYDDYFNIDKYVFASYDDELEATKSNLETIASDLLMHQQANRSQLFQIQASLDMLLTFPSSSEFKTSFKFVIMLDQSSMLEEKYKDMISKNYIDTLANLNTNVTDLLKKINAELSDRSKEKIIFTAGGMAGVVGIGPALVGAAKAIDSMVKTGGAVARVIAPGVEAFGACEAAVGAAATTAGCIIGAGAVGAGAGSAYVLYKQTYGKRIDARKAQRRRI